MAYSWILLGALVVLVVLLFKAKEIRHKFGSVAIIAVLIFFIFTFSQVATQDGVDFKSFDGIMSAGKIYFKWLGTVFSNLVTITGNAVKLDWGFNFTNHS